MEALGSSFTAGSLFVSSLTRRSAEREKGTTCSKWSGPGLEPETAFVNVTPALRLSYAHNLNRKCLDCYTAFKFVDFEWNIFLL